MRRAPAPAPLRNIKNISQKWESQTTVSSCPANFTPVTLAHLLDISRNPAETFVVK